MGNLIELNYDRYVIVNLLLSIAFSLVIILFFKILIKISAAKLEISDKLCLKHKIKIITITVFSVMLIFFNMIEFLLSTKSFKSNILFVDVLALIIYFCISIKNIYKTYKMEEKDLVIQNLKSYNKTLSIMYDNIRGFKHDFSNFIQSLDGYIQTNDMNGIKSMNLSVCKDCKNINSMGVLDPRIINNPAVYSLLTNKYYLAREYNIIMNIEIAFNILELPIETYKLCEILGILLDNAIESARECKNKLIEVRFVKDTCKNDKIIIIENTYENYEVEMDKIFEKGYSTKNDKKDHGLGLWNLNKIIKHSDNLKLYTDKGKMFSQKLVILEK